MRKTSLFSILLNLTLTGLFGQSTIDSKIIGSWKLTSYKENKKTWPVTTTDIISFYSDSTYQTTLPGYKSDSFLIKEAGIWLIAQSKNTVLFTNRHLIPNPANITMIDKENKIVEITDTSLIIAGNEGNDVIYLNYIKIPDLPQIEDNYDPSIQKPNYMSKPLYNFYLVNSANTSKQILIKRRIAVDLTYNAINFDTSIIKDQNIRLSGYIENMSDTSVSFVVWSESMSLELKNGVSKNTETDYFFTYNWEYRDININNIEYVTYTSPARETLNSIGLIITGYSVITTLLVAPLVSINYREGGFNSDRYFIWAGAGLAGLTIGIPLLSLADEKSYKIANSANTSDKNYWYLKKEY